MIGLRGVHVELGDEPSQRAPHVSRAFRKRSLEPLSVVVKDASQRVHDRQEGHFGRQGKAVAGGDEEVGTGSRSLDQSRLADTSLASDE